MELNTKTVLVTGGASGIGKAVAEAFLEKGALVAIVDSSEVGEAKMADYKDKYGKDAILCLKADVSDEESLKEAFETAANWGGGHLHVVINNAGIVNETQWKKMLAVNINGVISGTNLALEHMRKDKGGQGGVIINTSSVAGLASFYNCPAYTAAKSAIRSFTETLSIDPHLTDCEVRFCTVCPSVVETPIHNYTSEMIKYSDEIKAQSRVDYKFLSPARVAEAYIQLAEDDQSNGATLLVTNRRGFTHVRMRTEECTPGTLPASIDTLE